MVPIPHEDDSTGCQTQRQPFGLLHGMANCRQVSNGEMTKILSSRSHLFDDIQGVDAS
jgi:hypothetical protein